MTHYGNILEYQPSEEEGLIPILALYRSSLLLDMQVREHQLDFEVFKKLLLKIS
jgi:hypothetical protein